VAKLCCVFPPGTSKEIVKGHKLHMAIEIWEVAKIATAAAATAAS
jgi:hypothetical protein